MKKLAKFIGVSVISVGLLSGCQTKETVKLTEEEKFEKDLIGEWVAPEISFIYEFRKDGRVAIESALSDKEIYDYEVVDIEEGFAEIEMTQGYKVKTSYWKKEKEGVMIKSPFAGSSTKISLYKTE